MSSGEIDAKVIERCRQGDRDALRALYEAYKDQVYSMALYFFHGDRTLAHDVTQQVFVKVITTIHTFRGDSQISTWLYRLTMNACVDASRRTRGRRDVSDDGTLAALSAPGSIQADLESADTAREVQAAVSRLPEPYRLTVLLRYFDNLSYDEMAQALKCSRGTVASRLSRAHRLLARSLRSLNPVGGAR